MCIPSRSPSVGSALRVVKSTRPHVRQRLRAAFCDPRLSAVDRTVWFTLSTYANAENDAWPSATEIGLELAVHEKTVERSLRRLRQVGLIHRYSRPDGLLVWRLVVDLTDWDTLPSDVAAPASAPDISRYGGAPLVRPEEHMGSSGTDTHPESTPPRSTCAPAEEHMGSSANNERSDVTKRGGVGEATKFPPLSRGQVSDSDGSSALGLIARLCQIAGVLPPSKPTAHQLANVAGLAAQHGGADAVAAIAAKAVAARPTIAKKLVDVLDFPQDFPRIQVAARNGAPPPADPALVAQRKAAEDERKRQLELELEISNAAAKAKLEKSLEHLPMFLRARAKKAVGQ